MERIIRTEPDLILRKRAREVEPAAISSPEIRRAIRDLKDTLKKSDDGIGIAAPQIGILRRIFIISEEAKYVESEPRESRGKKRWNSYVYINPVALKHSKNRVDGVEGCLSVPGKFGIVARSEKITVKALDERGNQFTLGASKFLARVIQHELDHLDGVLFIDKVKRFIDVTKNTKKDEERL
ncbi:MAG: Peptide deformylase [Parcubacteria group bacterium GW2011_GWB1_52_7]|nr:MAG: Peptide deformylase [Parcubacteria group bacterium GW2011_GWA1_51_12]KKW29076.1 MAG: Peptide deformylase [Parcubacteria group bacterium GW2011_GWB1_52_7]